MKNKYGEPPVVMGQFKIKCQEMMLYQYLPIKMPKKSIISMERRLDCFRPMISAVIDNFVETFSEDLARSSYIYLTAKHQYQDKTRCFNRPGYHSDGFMTDDINYIWSDINPTVFNKSKFILSLDDQKSLTEMQAQALPENDFSYPENTLLRLNQYNIHRVADVEIPGMRTFIKISFSKDKYDLIGNSHNYQINYKWAMKPRKSERNIPQSAILIK